MRAAEKGWQWDRRTLVLNLIEPFPGTTLVMNKGATIAELKEVIAKQLGEKHMLVLHSHSSLTWKPWNMALESP